jgi:aspartate/methionine/tyrosine aminotransferase
LPSSTSTTSPANHFIQYGALEGLIGDHSGPRQILATLRERRDAAADALNTIAGVRCFKPNATFYLFPNVTGALEHKGFADVEELRRAVLHETGVSVCSRVHFGCVQPGESRHYVRLAYSGINPPQIAEGLGKLKAYLES